MIPQTSCPLGKDTVVGGESEQRPVKRKAQGRDPTCPSLRLVLLKSGHCLSTLGKELTAWRKWAGKSKELEPAAQPARRGGGGTEAEPASGRGKAASPTQARLRQHWPKGTT